MNSKEIFVAAAAVALGLLSPMAMADPVNSYYSTPTNQSAIDEVVTSSPVIIQESGRPVLIERTLSSPVMVEKTGSPPVLIEDRIIKQKHAFGMGIWPLFDFEVM